MAAPALLSPPLPGSPPSDSSVSVRSTSSLGGFSSSSSLASAFSDIPPPPSSGPKTDAFFASPFSTTNGSVGAATPPTPPRSITADFFATPVSSPSPPRRTRPKTPGLPSNIHPSRIFPSRYTACLDDDATGKQFIEVADSPAAFAAPTNPLRLPTPPPLSPCPPRHLALSDDEPTPRPPHLEPALFAPEPRYVDPSPGCTITSDPPCISSPPNLTVTLTPPPSNTTFADSNFEILSQLDSSPNETQLRLVRPLGQGAFSSVWLAQDKSLIPLTLRSKNSVRELRKKASIASLSRRSSSRGGLLGVCSNDGSAMSLSRRSSLEDKLGGSLKRDGSLRMKKLRARLQGTKPVGFGTRYVDERHGEMGIKERTSAIDPGSDTEHNPLYSSPPISASTSTSSAPDSTCSNADAESYALKKKPSNRGRLVAVKLTPRKPAADTSPGMSGRERAEEEERTRVGFVREVEILKHVSHPNITVLLEHMSTPSHHILVLPYLPGGDLLGLVNNDIAWSKLGESVLRRIWCELCKAVGWMHGVGLVHRDIKLENILLTTQTFSRLTTASPRPTLDSLPTPPTPLIKLSDFGLSRFIEVDERTGEGELLWTRCGSEAYAAPELVVGTGSARAQAAMKRHVSGGSVPEGAGSDHDEPAMTTRGFYDARETDAWACGVVLYALVGRKLPFGEGVGAIVGSEEECGEELSQKGIGGDGMAGYGARRGRGGMLERRQWLMKIARGDYEWPLSSGADAGAATPLACGTSIAAEDRDELVGQQLVESQGAQRIVARLLVRDSTKRARIMDLWDDDWMWQSGGGLAIGMNQVEWKERERDREQEMPQQSILDLKLNVSCGDGDLMLDEGAVIDGYYAGEGSLPDGGEDKNGEDAEEEVEELVDGEEGWLLDQEGIGSVARQEVV